MSVFATLPDNVIRKLAEKSQTYEYLADKVIEDDTKSQELIYICKRVNKRYHRRFHLPTYIWPSSMYPTHVFYKEPLYKEPAYRRRRTLRNLYN